MATGDRTGAHLLVNWLKDSIEQQGTLQCVSWKVSHGERRRHSSHVSTRFIIRISILGVPPCR